MNEERKSISIFDFIMNGTMTLFCLKKISTFSKCFLSLAICFIFINTSFAQKTEDDYATDKSNSTKQEKPKPPFRDRLVFGGNLGGYFGNQTFVQINPMVGYKTTDWWINGVGVNYMYVSSRNYSQSVYGASVWSRAYAFKSIFAQTEFEMLKLTARNPLNETFRANVPVWFVGGGYQSTGQGFGLSIMMLYDVIQDPNSPYNTPVFRIGGLFGF
jgi:hypothetical protein